MRKILKNAKYIVAMLFIALLFTMFLSACTIFDPLFNNGGDEVTYTPKVNQYSPPRFEKVVPDYVNPVTKEPDVYMDTDGGTAMSANTGDTVYIVIDLQNKSDLAISSVVVKDEVGRETVYKSADFSSNSTPQQVRIPIAVTEIKTMMKSYSVVKIFYTYSGKENALALDWEDASPMYLNINPSFKLTIDNRNGSATTSETLPYKTSLTNIIAAVTNLTDDINTPKKVGGWVFSGYFTKPNGLGVQVTNTDIYYFWKDITLYAHYERLFTFTVMSAEEYGISPIKEVTVDPKTSVETTKTYYNVAIINKKTTKGDLQSILKIENTIIDDKGVECAIVEIGDGAFSKTNTLDILQIGKYVRRIGKGAFTDSKMNQISFAAGGSLTVLDDRAFSGTVNLGKSAVYALTLPKTVKYLGDRCFDGSGWAYMRADGDVAARQTLVIYPEIEHIGDWCFTGTKFTAVEFMGGVKFKVDAVKGVKYKTVDNGTTITADYDYYLGWCLFKNCMEVKRFLTRTSEGKTDALEYVAPGMFDILTYNSSANVGLTNVQLGEGLKKIGRGAFHYQKLLTAIILPNSLEDICSENSINGPNEMFTGEGAKGERSEFGAFQNCDRLVTVTFSSGSRLKVLGCHAFMNNRALKSIRITSKVFEKFGDAPFEGCNLLTEVYFDFDASIPTPTPIDNYQRPLLSARKDGADFFYPSMSFKIFVTSGVIDKFQTQLLKFTSSTSRADSQILATEMIQEIKDGGGNVIGRMALKNTTVSGMPGWELGYFFSSKAEVIVPDTFNDINIISIGAYAFGKDVETVVLPQFLLSIGDNAFKDCALLRKIHFGNVMNPVGNVNMEVGRNSLQEIGVQAFYNTKIEYFIGGTNLKTIKNEAFYYCKEIDFIDLSLSQEIRTLGTGVFNRCEKMRYCRLPINLGEIPDAAFAENKSLLHLVLMVENPQKRIFPKAINTYFSGVPSGQIKTYTASESAKTTIMGAEYLPSQLVGNIIYDAQNPNPNPDKILLGFRCDDIMYYV